jgi:hypothetical protein
MKTDVILSGSWKSDKQSVKVRLPLIIFTENDNEIVYCPALDVSGYGKTSPEARHSFEISLDQFLTYTLHKNTLVDELRRLGWTVKSKKKAYPPTMQHLLENNDNFSRIFNDHSFTKIDEQFEIPVT